MRAHIEYNIHGTFSNMYHSALQVFFIIQYHHSKCTIYPFIQLIFSTYVAKVRAQITWNPVFFRFWALSHVVLNQIQI